MSIVLRVTNLYIYRTVISIPRVSPEVSTSHSPITCGEDDYLILFVPKRLFSMSLDSPNSLVLS